MFSRAPIGEGLAVKFLIEVCGLENTLWIEQQTQMAQGSFWGQFSEPCPWQLIHPRCSLPEEEAVRWPGSHSVGVELMELDMISIHLLGLDSHCLLPLFPFEWKTFQPAAQLFLVFPSFPPCHPTNRGKLEIKMNFGEKDSKNVIWSHRTSI